MKDKFFIEDIDPFDADPKVKFDPEHDPDCDPDEHNCREHSDGYGYCQFCGASIFGSLAYYEERGCDPPGTY